MRSSIFEIIISGVTFSGVRKGWSISVRIACVFLL